MSKILRNRDSRRTLGSLLNVGLLLACSTTSCLAGNPFITSIYTADPSAHVWADGRLYVYPSHDVDPPQGCDLMDRYHVFSTDDMVTWRDEGEILNSTQVEWGRKEGGFMWAPDCAYRDGTYYFYYPHPSGTDWNKTWKIGIATSSRPGSDFKPQGYLQGLEGNAMIDPAVFMDTDGQAYFYYGGGSVCKGGKLKSNMVEIDGAMQTMEGLKDFHEAAWVFKRKGLYYLTYADNNPVENRLQYATSPNPLGPWTAKGVYLEPTGCDTSHGSVVEYKGQWYAFYHNKSLSGKGNLRSICVDKLSFADDGSIQTVVQTKEGVPAVKKGAVQRPSAAKYDASSASLGGAANLAHDEAAGGGKNLGNLHLADSYAEWGKVSAGKKEGRATIHVHYSAEGDAKLRLTVNGVDYSYLNTPSTGAWNKYTGDSFLTVPLKAGDANTIRLTGGNGGVNVDYITVVPLP